MYVTVNDYDGYVDNDNADYDSNNNVVNDDDVVIDVFLMMT